MLQPSLHDVHTVICRNHHTRKCKFPESDDGPSAHTQHPSGRCLKADQYSDHAETHLHDDSLEDSRYIEAMMS